MTTHYETLGVDRTATIEEIAAAMRALRSQHHPDREGGSTEKMAAINAAFDVLSDPDKRRAYDASQPDTSRDALDLLDQIFKAALDGEADNIVLFSRTKLAEVKAKANAVQVDAHRQISKLEKRRTRIKVKAGVNLLHEIIDKRIESFEGRKAGCADTLAVVAKAEELIGAYVDDPEATEPQQPPMRWLPMPGHFSGFKLDEV